MVHVTDGWLHRTTEVAAGALTYTVFPGPRPFLGCSRLDAGHEDCALLYIGQNPGEHVVCSTSQ